MSMNYLLWAGVAAVVVLVIAGAIWAVTRKPRWEVAENVNAHWGLGPADHHFYGGDMTVDACQQACKDDAQCVAWSLTPNGTCHGRYANSPNVWRAQTGYTSGRRK